MKPITGTDVNVDGKLDILDEQAFRKMMNELSDDEEFYLIIEKNMEPKDG